MQKSLVTCSYLFALSQEQNDKDLDEIKLAVVGKWKGHPSGPFELTYKDLKQIKTNFENQEIDIVVDFEHASLWNDKAAATGWIKSLFFKGKDLWAKVKWIGDSKELIKSEQYKYISPVFDSRTIDSVSGDDIGWSLHSVALTNSPFLEELGEIIANNKNQKGDKSMTPEEQKKMDDLEQEVKDLKKENDDLKKEASEAEEKRVEEEVDTAIANSKATKEQKGALLAFGKTNPKGLTALLDTASITVVAPQNDMYANSNQNPNTPKYDVLKLGGIQ